MQNQTISVIGLGKLGLCLAASFAKRGIDVIGVDVLPEVVDELNHGRTRLCEPGLSELLAEFGGKRLKATLSSDASTTFVRARCKLRRGDSRWVAALSDLHRFASTAVSVVKAGDERSQAGGRGHNQLAREATETQHQPGTWR